MSDPMAQPDSNSPRHAVETFDTKDMCIGRGVEEVGSRPSDSVGDPSSEVDEKNLRDPLPNSMLHVHNARPC